MNNKNVQVSILMPTYNHEKYISKAIESALAQKTTFSFELLINDDCSTDGTAKIAQDYANKYPHIIQYFHQEQNLGLLKNYKFLFEKARGKYIAILESDDLWNDIHNLEKKISFLEQNEDTGLIASETKIIDENENIIRISSSDIHQSDNWYESMLYENPLKAVSVIFRRDLYDKYCNINDYINNGFLTIDYPIWLSIAAHSKCKYINEPLCSYRQIASSISNSSNYNKQKNFADSTKKIQKYIINLYPPSLSFNYKKQNNIININYMELALRHHKFIDYYKYAKRIKIKFIERKKERKKEIFIHYFTLLFYIQHIIRVKE